MAGKHGFGAKFFLHDGTSLVEITDVMSVSPPSPTVETIDTTTHASAGGVREFIAGLIDTGEGSIRVNWIPGSASDVLLAAAVLSRQVKAFKVNVPAGTGRGAGMSWIEWPSVLQPRNINITPPRQTKSLTKSLTNFEQVQPVIRPPWRGRLTFGTLEGDQVLAYRAFLAACEGRTNLFRLPIFDLHYWAGENQVVSGYVPHSDGSSFSDAALYVTDDLSGVTVTGIQGEKQIVVDFGGYGQILKAGQYFGIGNDLHIATGVWWDGTIATIKFTSSLRRDHTAARLRLRPFLIARLAEDETGDHELEYGRWTAPVLEFEEAFYEPLS